MHSTKIRAEHIRADFHVVGDHFMVLTARYDANQGWLSFMDRAVFAARPERSMMNEPAVPPNKAMYVRVSEQDKLLYPPVSESPAQIVLPFAEGKRISNSQYKAMQKCGFKAWDLDLSGEPYVVKVRSGERREEIAAWCSENCRRRFHIRSNVSLTFESEIDAVAAKLRFS
jgi:hypothetical protein